MSIQKVMTATLAGIDAVLVDVEADISNGLPTTIIVGLADTAILESRERVRLAIKHSGFQYPQTRVSVNLSPGYLPKVGAHFDLPIAVAILLSNNAHADNLESSIIIGELSLDGKVKPATGVLAMVQAAQHAGLTTAFVPEENAKMSSLVSGISIFAVQNLKQLIDHITGKSLLTPFIAESKIPSVFNSANVDLSSIAGQQTAKRALEIAASGNHNILMTGPPGSGKTMLAKALPGLLPELTQSEVLNLTKIYSSSGRLQSGVITHRPVRSPHHTSSTAALIGGGGIPRPGEVTLAHHGVLFLDEFPEFPRHVLEVLRQPLEDNTITITRSKHSYAFPASFILVAAQNPCPCGNFGEPELECICSMQSIVKYKKKISGPLLDRIDLHISVPRLSYSEMFEYEHASESSIAVRKRVELARTLQYERFGRVQTNNEMSAEQLKLWCPLEVDCSEMLKMAADKYNLSGRSIHRIIKVARTIADLEGSNSIELPHVSESLQYRLRDDSAA